MEGLQGLFGPLAKVDSSQSIPLTPLRYAPFFLKRETSTEGWNRGADALVGESFEVGDGCCQKQDRNKAEIKRGLFLYNFFQ